MNIRNHVKVWFWSYMLQISIGAELSQIQDGKERIISFGGEKLATTQKKYCTTRKELLAIVAFTWQYIHYLLGKLFVTRTAHNSLTWLLSFKNIEGQLARWIKDLAQYHMVIQHRAAKKTLKCLCAVKNTWWIPTMWRVRSRGTSE